MKICLEIHRYAPELNRVGFIRNGEVVAWRRSPGITTIREYRQAHAPVKPMIHAHVSSRYTGELDWLNRVMAGTVSHRSEAIAFARKRREQLVPDVAATVTIKTQLVYL